MSDWTLALSAVCFLTETQAAQAVHCRWNHLELKQISSGFSFIRGCSSTLFKPFRETPHFARMNTVTNQKVDSENTGAPLVSPESLVEILRRWVNLEAWVACWGYHWHLCHSETNLCGLSSFSCRTIGVWMRSSARGWPTHWRADLMLQGGKFLICPSKSRWQTSEVIWHRVTYFWSSWKQSWEPKENSWYGSDLRYRDMAFTDELVVSGRQCDWCWRHERRGRVQLNLDFVALILDHFGQDSETRICCIMLHPILWQEVEDCLAGNLQEERFSDLFRSWYRLLYI